MPLKNTQRKQSSSKVPLVTGQVWQMKEGHLQIGLVGKTLVHYKFFKGDLKRAPNSLASHVTLQSYLQKNKAVLAKTA